METGMHLCLTCPFAQAVWSQMSLWEGLNTFQQALPTSFDSINDWWEAVNKLVPKESRRSFNGMAIYIMWNVWKERNGRIFEQKYLLAQQVASKTKESLKEFKQAFTTHKQNLERDYCVLCRVEC